MRKNAQKCDFSSTGTSDNNNNIKIETQTEMNKKSQMKLSLELESEKILQYGKFRTNSESSSDWEGRGFNCLKNMNFDSFLDEDEDENWGNENRLKHNTQRTFSENPKIKTFSKKTENLIEKLQKQGDKIKEFLKNDKSKNLEIQDIIKDVIMELKENDGKSGDYGILNEIKVDHNHRFVRNYPFKKNTIIGDFLEIPPHFNGGNQDDYYYSNHFKNVTNYDVDLSENGSSFVLFALQICRKVAPEQFQKAFFHFFRRFIDLITGRELVQCS